MKKGDCVCHLTRLSYTDSLRLRPGCSGCEVGASSVVVVWGCFSSGETEEAVRDGAARNLNIAFAFRDLAGLDLLPDVAACECASKVMLESEDL